MVKWIFPGAAALFISFPLFATPANDALDAVLAAQSPECDASCHAHAQLGDLMILAIRDSSGKVTHTDSVSLPPNVRGWRPMPVPSEQDTGPHGGQVVLQDSGHLITQKRLLADVHGTALVLTIAVSFARHGEDWTASSIHAFVHEYPVPSDGIDLYQSTVDPESIGLLTSTTPDGNEALSMDGANPSESTMLVTRESELLAETETEIEVRTTDRTYHRSSTTDEWGIPVDVVTTITSYPKPDNGDDTDPL